MPDALRLLERIEKQAKAAIDEAFYAHSYETGSTRFNQAIEREKKAETKLFENIERLRAALRQ